MTLAKVLACLNSSKLCSSQVMYGSTLYFSIPPNLQQPLKTFNISLLFQSFIVFLALESINIMSALLILFIIKTNTKCRIICLISFFHRCLEKMQKTGIKDTGQADYFCHFWIYMQFTVDTKNHITSNKIFFT